MLDGDPFVSRYYCIGNRHLGPWHAIEGDLGGKWHFVDHPDYAGFGVDHLTDEQFKNLFNNSDPAVLARSLQEGGS